jgi:hypothetical protein
MICLLWQNAADHEGRQHIDNKNAHRSEHYWKEALELAPPPFVSTLPSQDIARERSHFNASRMPEAPMPLLRHVTIRTKITRPMPPMKVTATITGRGFVSVLRDMCLLAD